MHSHKRAWVLSEVLCRIAGTILLYANGLKSVTEGAADHSAPNVDLFSALDFFGMRKRKFLAHVFEKKIQKKVVSKEEGDAYFGAPSPTVFLLVLIDIGRVVVDLDGKVLCRRRHIDLEGVERKRTLQPYSDG